MVWFNIVLDNDYGEDSSSSTGLGPTSTTTVTRTLTSTTTKYYDMIVTLDKRAATTHVVGHISSTSHGNPGLDNRLVAAIVIPLATIAIVCVSMLLSWHFRHRHHRQQQQQQHANNDEKIGVHASPPDVYRPHHRHLHHPPPAPASATARPHPPPATPLALAFQLFLAPLPSTATSFSTVASSSASSPTTTIAAAVAAAWADKPLFSLPTAAELDRKKTMLPSQPRQLRHV